MNLQSLPPVRLILPNERDTWVLVHLIRLGVGQVVQNMRPFDVSFEYAPRSLDQSIAQETVALLLLDTIHNVFCIDVDEGHSVEVVVHEELKDKRNMRFEGLQNATTNGSILQ